MSLIYKIFKIKTKSWIKNWIYNQKKTPVPVYPLSEIITGEILTLTNGVRKLFNIFNVGGNTIQDGTPTPETPIPVQNVSGSISIKVENKNIYISSLAVNNMYQNYNNPYWSMSPNNSYWCTGLQKIKPNTNYTISTTPNITVCYDKDRNPIPQGLRGATITTQATAYYMNCCYVKNSFPFGSDLQIEEGSTATSYEPHEEQTATLSLPEGMEMCKIGTYQDSFVYQGGKWYKNKKVIKYVFVGTESWLFNGEASTPTNRTTFSLSGLSFISTDYLSDCFIKDSQSSYRLVLGVLGTMYISTDNNTTGITSGDSIATKVTKFKTWLTSNNVTLYTPATLVQEEITDTTLISDLNNLKNLYSYKGTTYITSSNAPSPVFEVQYYMEGDDV